MCEGHGHCSQSVTLLTQENLQLLLDRFAFAFRVFRLTLMGQEVPTLPLSICTEKEVIKITDYLTYVAFTVANNVLPVMARPCKIVWDNNQLTSNIKLKVYQACVICTFLYGSESCMIFARQEKRVDSFHLLWL